MTFLKFPLLIVLTAVTLLLESCAVYMPMQCAAPQITDKKQLELTASNYLNNRLELAAAYSPVRHLLVRAAGSFRSGSRQDSSYVLGRQVELGVGAYFPLGRKWLVGGLGGYGWAQSAAGYNNNGQLIFLGTSIPHQLEARYRKPFGEVYANYQIAQGVGLGAAYRVTHVRFTQLTDVGIPVPIASMTRSEPMLFVRAGPWAMPGVRFQLAWGYSSTFGYNDNARLYDRDSEAQVLKQRGYVALTLLPHLLKSLH